ncbi:MAG: acetoin dehydrogenase dihydrolipoyllysine-residue acetyltransferase subunit [Rhodospirillales bacterium]|nr:acetoin dehydrogenase dihydrolipoyllysine-residue acetyltransferase subunit [Rhodospirillales bacterium]
MSSAITPVTMPKWGLSMTDGTVTSWLAAEGDMVSAGQDLVEVETTKITNVCEAPAAGVLRRIVGLPGENLPVGALLAVLAEAAVPRPEIDAFIAGFQERFAAGADEGTAARSVPESVEASGIEINYLAAGGGAGTPIVFIHGFGGDLSSWQMNQAALAAGRRALALDLPGHGASAKSVPAGGIEGLAGVVAVWLDAVGVARAHLVGHSLGGAVALALALRDPARVASLSLLAPAGFGPDINGGFIEAFRTANKRKSMRAAVELLFGDVRVITPELIEDLLRYKRLEGVQAALDKLAADCFPNGSQATVLAGRVAELAMPWQVIWGAADRILPATQAEAAPAHQRHVLADAGHMVHMERANEVNRLIAALADG